MDDTQTSRGGWPAIVIGLVLLVLGAALYADAPFDPVELNGLGQALLGLVVVGLGLLSLLVGLVQAALAAVDRPRDG